MASAGSTPVDDPRALRALAHPLRLTLLALLRREGPSTASRLGERVGESSGTTSWHLRELARAGFVTELPERGNRRDRWWEAAAPTTSWQPARFADGEAAEVADALERRLVEQRGRLLNAWLEQRSALGPDWRAAADLSDDALRLTPEQARRLAAELGEVLTRWARAHPPAVPAEGTELVAVHLDVLPLQDWPL